MTLNESRNLIQVQISRGKIADLLVTGHCFEIIEGVLSGSILVNVGTDTSNDKFILIFEHPNYPAVEMGKPIPWKSIVMKQTLSPEAMEKKQQFLDDMRNIEYKIPTG